MIIKARFPDHLDIGFMMMKNVIVHMNDGTSISATVNAFNDNEMSVIDTTGEYHRVDMTTVLEVELV